jgi:hypothetical protein
VLLFVLGYYQLRIWRRKQKEALAAKLEKEQATADVRHGTAEPTSYFTPFHQKMAQRALQRAERALQEVSQQYIFLRI